MNISKSSDNKAKIVLNKKDMKELEISFEILDSDEISAKIFLGSLITLLKDLEIIDIDGDITVDIMQNGSEEMIIYITSQNDNKSSEYTTALYFFDDWRQVINFCRDKILPHKKSVSSSELYWDGFIYAMIIRFKCSERDFFSQEDISENAVTNIIKIAKAKEHGKLISRAPLKKIFELP